MTNKRDGPDRLLTPEEAAEILNVSVNTLRQWRSRQRGVPWIKVGHFARYKTSDLLRYIEENTQHPK